MQGRDILTGVQERDTLSCVQERDIPGVCEGAGCPGECAGAGYPDGCAVMRYSGGCAATRYFGGCAGVCVLTRKLILDFSHSRSQQFFHPPPYGSREWGVKKLLRATVIFQSPVRPNVDMDQFNLE